MVKTAITDWCRDMYGSHFEVINEYVRVKLVNLTDRKQSVYIGRITHKTAEGIYRIQCAPTVGVIYAFSENFTRGVRAPRWDR